MRLGVAEEFAGGEALRALSVGDYPKVREKERYMRRMYRRILTFYDE